MGGNGILLLGGGGGIVGPWQGSCCCAVCFLLVFVLYWWSFVADLASVMLAGKPGCPRQGNVVILHCRPGCWVHALLLLCAIVGLCVLLASSSILAGPLVGGTVPHCFAMYLTAPLSKSCAYLTAPLPNHVPTSLLSSQSVFLPDYLALSWP